MQKSFAPGLEGWQGETQWGGAATQKYTFIATPDKAKPDVWWLYPNEECPYPADEIFVGSTDMNTKSEGFGGATITFQTDRGEMKLKGPWKSNSGSLFASTGIDLRQKHGTRGVISFSDDVERDSEKYPTWGLFHNPLHLDEDWVMGSFKRIDTLAQELANQYGRSVRYYVQSQGGASSATKQPE